MFYRALANFTVRNVGSTDCRKQTETYERHLRNHTSWAMRMAESWNRHPIGTLTGNNYHMGIYDECVDVRYPVRGKYCLSEIKLFPPVGKDYSFNRTEYQNYYGNNHAWHTILGWANYPDQVQRNILRIGICIPDSCSALDLQLSLQNQFDSVFNSNQLKPIVNVDPIMCTTSGDMYPRNSAYLITSTVLSLLVLICCSATFYHFIVLMYQEIQKDNCEFSDSVFNAFSFIKSGKELLKFDKENELNSLNGYKAAIMVVILFGHRFMFLIYLYGPSILLTCMNTVDPFFFISGYLTYTTVSPVFKKTGSVLIKLALPIIYRIVRMLPAYCAMMAITAHIIPHLGDGPLWPQKTWEEAEKCKKYWWTNLLFISNFIDVKYQCLLVSWYVSCDIQFFIIGVIIVFIYTKNVKFGTGLLIFILVMSLSVPFIVTILMKGDGILKVHLPFLENLRSSNTFNELYRPSYMRATPYFSGLAISFIVKKLKKNKFHFSQKTVFGGTFIVTAISVWVQTYAMIFYKRDRRYYPLEQALYSTLSHCTWPLIAAWVFICLFTSGYGPITKVFNNRYAVPFGRLSYSVYLVNLVVMMMSQSVQRLPNYLSVKSLLDAWIYDTFKCYFMGLILYLVIEAPFGNLTRKMFGRRQKEKSSNKNGTQIKETISAENPKKEISHF